MNIALLTGRGGSISLPDKNILPVLGRPMMAYPAIMAKEAKLIDDVYLSTDGESLKQVGREMGLKIIDRPAELALPTSQHRDAIEHALDRVLQALDATCLKRKDPLREQMSRHLPAVPGGVAPDVADVVTDEVGRTGRNGR